MNDILTNKEFSIVEELDQQYPRFNVYNVYKIYKNTNEKKFMYKTTHRRTDFGRKIGRREDNIKQLQKELGLLDE